MNMLTSLVPAEATPSRRVTESDFFLPLLIIGGLTLLVVVLGTHLAVRGFDRASAVREQILAQNGIGQRIDEVATMVLPQTMWDDATAHLDARFDPKWAEENIGQYLNQTNGITASYIVDGEGRAIFASRNGHVVGAALYAPMAKLAAPLIDAVRRQERKRGPLHVTPTSGMLTRAIQSSSLERVDGKPAIVTASLVQPDFGKALPAGPRSPVVITMMPINQSFLDSFSARYMLDGLHVDAVGAAVHPGEIAIPARTVRGATIGYFAWRPLAPGYTMLREFLPPLGFVMLMLAALAFVQLRKIHVAARRLLDREDRFAAKMHSLHDWQFAPVAS